MSNNYLFLFSLFILILSCNSYQKPSESCLPENLDKASKMKFTTIDKAIEKLIKKRKSDSLISIRKIDDTSHPDFVINLSNDYINYKNSPIKFNRHYLKPKYRSLGYILISKIDSFNKTKSMLGNNCIGFEIRDDTEIIDINNLLDFKFASSVYNNQKKNNE